MPPSLRLSLLAALHSRLRHISSRAVAAASPDDLVLHVAAPRELPLGPERLVELVVHGELVDVAVVVVVVAVEDEEAGDPVAEVEEEEANDPEAVALAGEQEEPVDAEPVEENADAIADPERLHAHETDEAQLDLSLPMATKERCSKCSLGLRGPARFREAIAAVDSTLPRDS